MLLKTQKVGAPVAAAMLVGLSMLEQSNITSDASYAAVYLAN